MVTTKPHTPETTSTENKLKQNKMQLVTYEIQDTKIFYATQHPKIL